MCGVRRPGLCRHSTPHACHESNAPTAPPTPTQPPSPAPARAVRPAARPPWILGLVAGLCGADRILRRSDHRQHLRHRGKCTLCKLPTCLLPPCRPRRQPPYPTLARPTLTRPPLPHTPPHPPAHHPPAHPPPVRPSPAHHPACLHAGWQVVKFGDAVPEQLHAYTYGAGSLAGGALLGVVVYGWAVWAP